jgi:hypothetical protein
MIGIMFIVQATGHGTTVMNYTPRAVNYNCNHVYSTCHFLLSYNYELRYYSCQLQS